MRLHIDRTKHGRSRGTRSLGSLTGIVIHITEGYNGGDLSVLTKPDGNAVQFFVPDYDDPGASQFIHGDDYTVYQLLGLDSWGWSIGKCREPYTNRNTISIELGNRGSETFPKSQLEILDQLIAWIDGKVGRKLPIVGHAEIALPSGRKSDPGPKFPMGNYKKCRKHVCKTQLVAGKDGTVEVLDENSVGTVAKIKWGGAPHPVFIASKGHIDPKRRDKTHATLLADAPCFEDAHLTIKTYV